MFKRSSTGAVRKQASRFAALGDETRLKLLLALCASAPLSITQLTAGSGRTRQAITKHLAVLERAGLASKVRVGRESLFQLEQEPLGEAARLLDDISQQWDQALARLKAMVEK